MEKTRKLNKKKVSIVVVLIMMFFTVTVFGRYIHNSIREAYFTAKQFYFSSNILTVNGAEFQYDDWGGLDVYSIPFELYSYNNQVSKLDYNLDYSVTCSTSNPDKIKCTVNSYDATATNTDTGTIPATTNTSEVVIFVTPLVELSENETVKIQVTARTEVPYQKEISCEFTLKIQNPGGITYSIEDSDNKDYAILKITNTNEIASQVTLQFDPDDLRIDMNDEVYINRITDGDVIVESGIDGKNYAKKVVFNLEAETTKFVKFYKVDKTQNYTYTGLAGTSAITVTT